MKPVDHVSFRELLRRVESGGFRNARHEGVDASLGRCAAAERSVAVAGRMCAIYPWRSPGGWHLLGRTPVVLFDTADSDPAWLHPGDQVRWVAIGRERYDALERAAAAGTLRREAWRDGNGALS